MKVSKDSYSALVALPGSVRPLHKSFKNMSLTCILTQIRCWHLHRAAAFRKALRLLSSRAAMCMFSWAVAYLRALGDSGFVRHVAHIGGKTRASTTTPLKDHCIVLHYGQVCDG